MDDTPKFLKNFIYDAQNMYLYDGFGVDASTDYSVAPSEVLEDIILMIQDYYVSRFHSEDNNIGIQFSNGQRFLLSVTELVE